MNVSLALLSLTGVQNSPLFISTTKTENSRFHFFKVKASHTFSAFSYNLLTARYSSCSFSNFLNSVISVDKDETFNQLYIRTPLTSSTDTLIDIEDCIFESENSLNGGAINIYKEGCKLTILRSAFIKCSCQNRGGAISFFGKTFICENSCFSMCETHQRAMAIECFMDKTDSKIRMNHVTLDECGPLELDVGKRDSIYLVYAAQMLKHINSTTNNCYEGGAFGLFKSAESVSMSMVTMANNTGKSMFSMLRMAKEIEMTMFNILHCGTSQMEDGMDLFVMKGCSGVILEKSAIFACSVANIVVHGDLTFLKCVTDLPKTLKTVNGTFKSVKSVHGKTKMQTMAIRALETHMCYLMGSKIPEKKQDAAEIASSVKQTNNGGLSEFIICFMIMGAITAVYRFMKRNQERDINQLEDVKMETL